MKRKCCAFVTKYWNTFSNTNGGDVSWNARRGKLVHAVPFTHDDLLNGPWSETWIVRVGLFFNVSRRVQLLKRKKIKSYNNK